MNTDICDQMLSKGENRCFSKFRKIRGKTLTPESLFNNVAGFQSTTLLKKRFQHNCFPVNFAKFIITLEQLLL